MRLLLGQAHAAALAKDFTLAKGYLTTASVKEPNNIVVLNNLANTLYQLNQFDEAIDILHKVITIEPNQTRTPGRCWVSSTCARDESRMRTMN